jgi:hypothetical protein
MNHQSHLRNPRQRSGQRSRQRRSTAVVAAGVAALLTLAGCSTPAPASDPSAAAVQVKPSVASVTPTTASVSQQRTVTITGRDLSQVKTVEFGSVPAKVRAVDSPAAGSTATIKVTAPPAVDFQSGPVTITLKNAKGKVVAAKDDVYSYAAKTGVDKQLQYAMTYWQNYNTAQYGDLNSVGGDCANFVSQTLVARGWPMTDEWYNHDAAADWSPAWGYVPAMDEYFAQNAAQLGLQELSFDQRDKVALGDVAIFDWDNDGSPDHTQIVTAIKKVNGVIKIEMASHNDDGPYRDLDELITQQHPGAIGHFWHLTR